MTEAYKKYRRSQIAELADWHPGFDMERVSISAADKDAGSPKLGDKIARNPANHDDRWLVAADYFAVNFEPVTVSENTTPVCPNCGATSWADFYRGSSVIASVCKKCDHKITPPVTAVSEKGEAEALLKSASALLGGSHNSTLFEDQCGHLASQIDAYLSRRQG